MDTTAATPTPVPSKKSRGAIASASNPAPATPDAPPAKPALSEADKLEFRNLQVRELSLFQNIVALQSRIAELDNQRRGVFAEIEKKVKAVTVPGHVLVLDTLVYITEEELKQLQAAQGQAASVPQA